MDFRTKDDRDANVQIRFEDKMKKTFYIDLEGNQICVGDMIYSTDGTYECRYGLYEKDGIELRECSSQKRVSCLSLQLERGLGNLN